MEYPLLGVVVLVLLNFTKVLSAQVLVPSMNPIAVGNNVTLKIDPPMTISVGTWSFGIFNIIVWFAANSAINANYINRVAFNYNNSELSLMNVSQNDSGDYILQGLTPSVHLVVTLSVLDSVSNVNLMANTTDLLEMNDTAVLACASLGSSPSFRWFNGSLEVTAGLRIHTGNGGVTLTIHNVTRYDQGPFTCTAFNAVSNATSNSLLLNVRYGPDNLSVSVVPEMMTHRAGSNITISCFAQSNPSTFFQWHFEGALLNQQGPHLHLQDVKHNQTGNYTCVAYNNITFMYASANMRIIIIDPISAVKVIEVGKLPSQNRTFTLSCEVTGPVNTIHWIRNGSLISPDNKTVFIDNSSITFTSIQRSDDGHYQCAASNAVSNKTSLEYRVGVYYGPEMLIITGPTLAQTGSHVTFHCSASSLSPNHFSWFFNGTMVAEGEMYTATTCLFASMEMYTCVVYNNVTERNSTISTEIIVIEPVTVATVFGAHPVENQPFTLACETSGTVYSIKWMKNGLLLSPDNRTVFSMDNGSMTFQPVHQTDNGNYQCAANNPLSNKTSTEYQLLVNYGPRQTIIFGPVVAQTGSTVTFNCSASSQPPSHFRWFFNNSMVAESSEYTTHALTLAGKSNYTCVAHNNVTEKNSTATVEIIVIDAIASVKVSPSTSIPIENQNLMLTCDVIGPYERIYWLKDDQEVNNNSLEMISIVSDNHVMSFSSLQVSNNGNYQCVAFNLAGAQPSPVYQLMVNYGPSTANISGPSTAKVQAVVKLTCSADSQPTSQFQWKLNNQNLMETSSQITANTMVARVSKYTCIAINPRTSATATAMFNLTISGTSAAPPHYPLCGLVQTTLISLSFLLIRD